MTMVGEWLIRGARELGREPSDLLLRGGHVIDARNDVDAVRDVAIAALHNFNDQMAAPDRRGVASLIEQLRGEQQQANEDLAPLVSEDNLKALRESMDELVRGAEAAAA